MALDAPVKDSVAQINDEIAVGEDLEFQRRWWRFERIVWVFFTLIIGLDLAGGFGRGPLANARIRGGRGDWEVSYERIERSGTPSLMTVRLGAAALRQGRAELFLGDSAIEALGLRRVIPAPEKTLVGRGGLTYEFPSSGAPAVVRFEFEPVSAGLHTLDIGIPGVDSVSLSVAVVP